MPDPSESDMPWYWPVIGDDQSIGGTARMLLVALLVASFLSPASLAQAQSTSEDRSSTEQRLNALRAQIERDQDRLAQTAEEEQASLQTLEKLQREIALREELEATYQERMRQLREERSELRTSLSELEGRLDNLRDEYKTRAVHAYKYGRLHDVALIFAAQSINQMLIRARYLHRFAEQRQEKRTAIQAAATELQNRRDQLEATREETERLLAEASKEQKNLVRLQNDRQRVVRELRAQRSTLREEIEKNQSAARQLENRIREMIAAEEAANQASGQGLTNEQLAEYASLSASFQENQGELPWPAQGAITEPFGDRVDPVHGTTTYHPGILIATNPRGPVRAVFDGVVTGIDFVPGYGTYLVVRHGDYLSVYSNFSELYVSGGDRVRAGQLIGQAGTESEPRGAGIFFAVFDKEKNESVNPMTWLRSR